MSVKAPKSMVVIYFSLLCKLYWQFVINVNYRQQTPPHLGFYSSSIKGWITQDNLRTSHQHKTIPSHTCSVEFKVSTMKLWVVEKWNNPNFQSSHLEKHFKIFLKTKHSLPYSFVVLSNHSVYMVFLDPYQGINDFCLLFTYL